MLVFQFVFCSVLFACGGGGGGVGGGVVGAIVSVVDVF